MVSMSAPRTAPRVARTSLRALIGQRDASIAVQRFGPATLALRRMRATAVQGLALLVAVLAELVMRHGLVVGGLAAFVLAAAQHSTTAALVTGGIGAFFLELRRK